MTTGYYRFTFDYDRRKAFGSTLDPLITAVGETVDRALREDFGGYVRGSLTFEEIARPGPPEPPPNAWLGVLA